MTISKLRARTSARPMLGCIVALTLLACSDVHSDPESADAGEAITDGSASDSAPPEGADGGETPTGDGGDAGIHADAWIPAPAKSCGLPEGTLRLPEDGAELADCTDMLGSVAITDTALTSLAGVEQLRTIAGSLTIAGNASLVDLRGANALRIVGGDVEVRGNALLATLQGLEELETIEGSLTLAENGALQAAGLRQVRTLGDTLRIEANPRLTSLHDLSARAQKALVIVNNASLSEADAYLFAADAFFEAAITISGNRAPSETPDRECGEPDLEHRGVHYDTLAGCTHWRGSLNLGDTGLSQLRALGNLRSIAGNLSLFRPRELIDLRGLEQLETIGGWLSIRVADKLETLDGAERLRSVGELRIDSNFVLRSVTGLQALESVEGDLMISGNEQLSQDAAQSFADGLTVGGEKSVGSNGP